MKHFSISIIPEIEEAVSTIRIHPHEFSWRHEYVTPHPGERSRVARFYRGRWGLLGAISELEIPIEDEMWHSITPELIAKEHARIYKAVVTDGILLDPFCGYGSDILYQGTRLFAIGCDINEDRLLQARRIRERLSQNRVDYVVADFVRGKSCFRESHVFDIVHLSPPWGHVGIRNRKIEKGAFGSRRLHQLTVDGTRVFQNALKLVKRDNIAYYLPRGIYEPDLIRLATLTRNTLSIVAQVHYSYDPNDETVPKEKQLKMRGMTVYFGDLSNQL